MDRFQALATFVKVMETGSFSAAARQLNVGQPAVSKTIAQLESQLQVSLLVRSTHRLTATEAGQIFFEHARAALGKLDEAEAAARGAGAELLGRVRVSAPTTFARIHIVPRLPEFLARYPNVEVEILLDDRRIDLVAEGIDLAIRLGQQADSTAVARRLVTGRRSVIATPAYLEREGVPQSPAELGGHEAIMHSQLPDTWSFTRDGTETSITLHGRVRLSAAEGQRAAVLADIGLIAASDWMFSRELENGSVRRVLSAWTLPTLDLWAVFPSGHMKSAKAQRFAEFVETVMSATHSSIE